MDRLKCKEELANHLISLIDSKGTINDKTTSFVLTLKRERDTVVEVFDNKAAREQTSHYFCS